MILSIKRPARIFVAIDFPWLNKTLNNGKKFGISTHKEVFLEGIQLAIKTEVKDDGVVVVKNINLHPQIDGHIFYDQLNLPLNIDSEAYKRNLQFEESMHKFKNVNLNVIPVPKDYKDSNYEHRCFFTEQFAKHTLIAINDIMHEIIIIVSGNPALNTIASHSKKQIFFFSDESMKNTPNTQWRDIRQIHWYKLFEENYTRENYLSRKICGAL